MKLYIISFCLILNISSYLNSLEVMNEVNAVEMEEFALPRILELFPSGWIEYPTIEPCIPKNYVADTLDRHFDTATRVIWGEKRDLELFKKGEKASIKNPIFYINHASGIDLTNEESNLGENIVNEKLDMLEKSDKESVKVKELDWGKYPVFAFEYKFSNENRQRFATIPLGSKGHVMVFELISPSSDQDRGEQKTKEIWDNFLSNTKQLLNREHAIAMGMDLRDGFTNFRYGTASFKVIAEKRKSDNQVAVLVTPRSPDISFKIDSLDEGKVPAKWKNNEPCLIVRGKIIQKKNKKTYSIESTIFVLLKKVNDFSFDPKNIFSSKGFAFSYKGIVETHTGEKHE